MFWLVHWIVCVLCDWLEWLLWFRVYDTRRTRHSLFLSLSYFPIHCAFRQEKWKKLLTAVYILTNGTKPLNWPSSITSKRSILCLPSTLLTCWTRRRRWTLSNCILLKTFFTCNPTVTHSVWNITIFISFVYILVSSLFLCCSRLSCQWFQGNILYSDKRLNFINLLRVTNTSGACYQIRF